MRLRKVQTEKKQVALPFLRVTLLEGREKRLIPVNAMNQHDTNKQSHTDTRAPTRLTNVYRLTQTDTQS